MHSHYLCRSTCGTAWFARFLIVAAFVLFSAGCATPNGPGSPLTANAGADRTISAGQSVALSGSAAGGTPPYTYSWSGSGFAGSNQQTTTVGPTATTVYTLTVRDSASPAATAQDTVTVTVTAADTCGNGTVDAGEQCDDGNTVGGDGCDPTCALESCNPGEWRQAARVFANDVDTEVAFGWAVAVSGDVAVIGADHDSANGLRAGAAYVFRRSGGNWTQEKRLLPDVGAAEDRFGHAVAVDGDVVVVGAWGRDDNGPNSGAAYIFRRSGVDWVLEQKLLASDGASPHVFGTAVAISGDTVLVSAPSKNDNGTNSGAVYAFRFDGSIWQEEQILLAGDGNRDDAFGNSLDLDGDVAVIGAYQDSDIEEFQGSAYVFRFDGTNWQQEQKLTANDGADDDRFGQTVSVSGDLLVVGAYQNDTAGADSGSAYVFRRNGNTWDLDEKLVPSDGGARAVFGWTVSIFGELVVAGSPGAAPDGAAYVFRGNGGTWTQERKLLPVGANAGSQFGYSVAAADDEALVGAYSDENNGDKSGAVYFFEVCD